MKESQRDLLEAAATGDVGDGWDFEAKTATLHSDAIRAALADLDTAREALREVRKATDIGNAQLAARIAAEALAKTRTK